MAKPRYCRADSKYGNATELLLNAAALFTTRLNPKNVKVSKNGIKALKQRIRRNLRKA